MADELLPHAAALLTEPRVTGGEPRYIAGCLRDSLGDVKRVAESRGARPGQGNSASDGHDLPS